MKQMITFSCGHTCKMELSGKRTERERQVYAMEHGICPDCVAAENAKLAEEAAAEAKEMHLPQLTGTEKQIAWAEQLRMAFVQDISDRLDKAAAAVEKIADPEEHEKQTANLNKMRKVYKHVIESKTSASWWIDARFNTPTVTFHECCRKYVEQEETIAEQANAADAEADAKAEATVEPENRTHEGTVEIRTTDDAVSAHYIKDDDFREIVKSLQYKWDADKRCWKREINQFTGSAVDRAAELGNHLLRAGFAVTIWDDAAREKSVSAEFEPECNHWLMMCVRGEYVGWFAVRFPRGEQDTYDKARKIKGSRWSSPNVVVPAERWREIEDFAECSGFRISPRAAEKIEEMRNAEYTKVSPAELVIEEKPDKLKEILNTDSAVIDDLKDD